VISGIWLSFGGACILVRTSVGRVSWTLFGEGGVSRFLEGDWGDRGGTSGREGGVNG